MKVTVTSLIFPLLMRFLFLSLILFIVPVTAQNQSTAPVQLEMTSQAWRGNTWKHQLTIYRPQKLEFPKAALISIQTRPTPFDGFLGQLAANMAGAPFVSLYDVPNQPLFGKTEDELLAYSLKQAIDQNDLTWPLVFPMAKSITSSMDTLQTWSVKEKTGKIEKFILIGASKRGWAAWLAATDPRVAGLVSIGYNNLNLEKQAPNQIKQWGELSPLLQDYTKRGLWQKMQTPIGKKVTVAIDPYTQRDKITCPKFVIDSTNNGFWTLDAFDQYADGLKGETSFLMIANAGHYMENEMPKIFGSIAAWSRRVLRRSKVPKPQPLDFFPASPPGQPDTLIYQTLNTPEEDTDEVSFYYGFSKSPDFRHAHWIKKTGEIEPNTYDSRWLVYLVPLHSIPKDKPFIAAFVQSEYGGTSQPLRLTSRVLIWDSRAASTDRRVLRP